MDTGESCYRHRRSKSWFCRTMWNLSGERTVCGHNSEKPVYKAPKEQCPEGRISQVSKQRKMTVLLLSSFFVGFARRYTGNELIVNVFYQQLTRARVDR